jgi:hypothetical protein
MIIDVDEARRLCGFDSLNGNSVANIAFRAIKASADKKETSTSVEFRRFQLRKYSIKDAREIIEDKGYKVNVSDSKGIIKLHISWFFPADKETVLVF